MIPQFSARVGAGVPAPAILTGPTWTDNGDGTATVAFTTDIASTGGINYGASAGTYTASSMVFVATTTFSLTVPESPGTEFGLWYWRIYLETAGGFAGYVGSENDDTIAPVLSAAADGTPTTTGATDAQVTTNADSGTLYWCLVTNGGSATNAQIIAGTGGNIVAGTDDSQSVTVTGVQTFDVVGAAASTAYQIKTLHVVSGAQSNQGSVNLTTAASFTPSDYGTVWAWYKKGTGQSVSEWTDQSGNARDLVQPTAGNQPTVVSGAMVFDGVDNVMISDNTAEHIGAAASVAIRFKWITYSSPSIIFNFSADGVADRMDYQQSGSSPNIEMNSGTALNGSGEPATDTYTSSIAVFNGASSALRFDATTVTGATGATTGRGLCVGAYSSGIFAAEVTIEEIIVWSTAVDAGGTDGDAIVTYLSSL